jgi:hypothetical protein
LYNEGLKKKITKKILVKESQSIHFAGVKFWSKKVNGKYLVDLHMTFVL